MLKNVHEEKSQSRVENLSFAVVGLARNCEGSIRADVYRIRDAIASSKSIVWLIVESDSADNTVGILKSLQFEMPNFNYFSLGNLSNKIPKRTERISYCRNFYAEQIKSNPIFSGVDFVVVADLDNLNTILSREAFESCWVRQDWDVCFANQKGPYYDIWALRHKDWCAEDCWAQYKFLNRYNPNSGRNIESCIYSKMITIPEDAEWIEVESAFGGFALYRRSAFDLCEYVGVDEMGSEFCEHTHFHKILKVNGARLFINPRLINANWTEHTINLLFFNRVKRRIGFWIKDILLKSIGFEKVSRLQLKIKNLYGFLKK